jgi:patatin-like phospholipase/acyl hydrolase
MFRIASTDGGGSRAVVSAQVWAEVEKKAQGPLRGSVDLFAGTSAGAIVSCALASGMTPLAIGDLLTRFAPRVFGWALGKWVRLHARHGFSAPKHDERQLEVALREVFEDQLFGDLPTPCLVPAYDLTVAKLRVYISTQEPDAGLPIWEIVKASSSAPTFFGAHQIFYPGQRSEVLVDGGLGANNPTALAVMHLLRQGIPADEISAISVGTGDFLPEISSEDADEWGAFEWMEEIFNVYGAAGSSAMHQIATGLLPKGHLIRLQPKLEADQMKLDAFSLNDLARLAVAAIHATAQGGHLQLPLRAAGAMLRR